MKKSLIFVGLLAISYANAQEGRVGINTQTPSATMNIKSRDDAQSPKNLELENQTGAKLVTVLNNGNMGINTENPDAKLHINGKVKITDGTQGEGKVLMSDANGIASWKETAVTTAIGSFITGTPSTINKSNEGKWVDAGMFITLPPGKWLIKVNVLFVTNSNTGVWLQTTLADHNHNTDEFNNSIATLEGAYSKDFIEGLPRLISGGKYVDTVFGTANSGVLFIHNQTTEPKMYRLIGRVQTIDDSTEVRFGGHANAENIIYATRIA